MLLLRELLDPKYGMFKYYEESRLQWFAPVVSFIGAHNLFVILRYQPYSQSIFSFMGLKSVNLR